MFYTESDQILHVRDVNRLLHIASSEVPNHVLPHRISPVPRRVDMGPLLLFDWGNGRVLGVAAGTKAMAEFARNAPKKVHRIADVTKASCCFDRSQCVKHRSHWKQGGHSSVELFQIADPTSGKEETVRDSFALVAGEGNFLRRSSASVRRIPTGGAAAATTRPPGPHRVAPSNRSWVLFERWTLGSGWARRLRGASSKPAPNSVFLCGGKFGGAVGALSRAGNHCPNPHDAFFELVGFLAGSAQGWFILLICRLLRRIHHFSVPW